MNEDLALKRIEAIDGLNARARELEATMSPLVYGIKALDPRDVEAHEAYHTALRRLREYIGSHELLLGGSIVQAYEFYTHAFGSFAPHVKEKGQFISPFSMLSNRFIDDLRALMHFALNHEAEPLLPISKFQTARYQGALLGSKLAQIAKDENGGSVDLEQVLRDFKKEAGLKIR